MYVQYAALHVYQGHASTNNGDDKIYFSGPPWSSIVKNLLFNVGDVGSIPGWGTKISCDSGPGSPSFTEREALMPQQRPSTAKQTKQKQDQDLFLEDPPRDWSGGCLKRRSKDNMSAVRVTLT